MKKVLLPVLVFITAYVMAQTKSGYVPFHQYFLSNNGNIQSKQGAARSVTVFGEIAFMHFTADTGAWSYSDSGQFFFSQNPNVIWVDSGNYFQFNSHTLNWFVSGRLINTVDSAFGQVQTSVTQSYDTTSKSFNNVFEYQNTFNNMNYLASNTFETWNGSMWVDSTEHSTTYGSTNYDSVVVVQSGALLTNDTQYLYTYNGFQNTVFITQVWSNGSWINLYKQSNSFDANGNNYQSFISQWDGTGWTNYALVIKGYDLNNEMVSYVYELWNASLGAYVNSYQEGYTWTLGNNTQFENFNWNTSTNAWVPATLNTYNYDNNHNVIYEADQVYNVPGDTFANISEYYYHYRNFTVTSIKDIPNDIKLTLFPNPSSGLATISFNSTSATEVMLNVYDARENLVKQKHVQLFEGNNSIPVNISEFAAGNYFVQLLDLNTNKSGMVQMVKQ